MVDQIIYPLEDFLFGNSAQYFNEAFVVMLYCLAVAFVFYLVLSVFRFIFNFIIGGYYGI